MHKSLMLLLSPLLLTACIVPGTLPDYVDCPIPGQTTVNIKYGDSQIKVTPPLVKVKKGRKLIFNLQPDPMATDPTNYNTVTVTLEGKSEDNDDDWLNMSGNKVDDDHFEVCAPDPGGTKPVTYEYMVTVQEVGQLDPRAEVDPQ